MSAPLQARGCGRVMLVWFLNLDVTQLAGGRLSMLLAVSLSGFTSRKSSCSGGRLALICMLVALSAPSVVRPELSELRKVQVAKNQEIDGCGVTSSELPVGQSSPLSYRLLLDADLEGSQFAGILEISLQINRPGSRILLNAHQSLDIEEIWYKDFGRISDMGKDGERMVGIESACLNTQRQILVLNLERELEADSLGLLNFAYLGKYSNSSDGLFKMSYQDKSGRSHLVVQSELEPRPELSVARKLFPCFDEPQMEAPIKLEVARESGVQARSNSEPESDTEMNDGTGRKLIKFRPTEPIAPHKLYLTLTN